MQNAPEMLFYPAAALPLSPTLRAALLRPKGFSNAGVAAQAGG
jgi:hypothetical protein